MIQPADIGPFTSPVLSDWSSFLGPIEGLGAFTAGWVLLRRHNCHVKGCWRISRCAVPGTHYVVCHRHHPGAGPPSHQDVIDAHDAHVASLARETAP
jgi:hypothetical protein